MIIAGAGIIGLACAWRLAQRGVAVTLFDAGPVAREASWAGAGMLAPGGECEAESPLTRMSVASLSAYPEFVEELKDATGLPIDFRRCGAVELALTPEGAQALAQRAERQAAAGIPSEPTSWPGSVAARYYPGDAVVDPRELTAGLRIACESLGAEIHQDEPVLSIDPFSTSITTAQGDYFSDGIIVAAGAWSSELLPGERRTYPVKGHLVAWDAEPGTLQTILRHNSTYLVQRSSGRLIAGTSVEHAGYDRTIDQAVVDDIRRRATGLLPVLNDLPVAEIWNGLRPAIEGETPAIGRIAGTNIWTAFGHYRNGILLAPETARQIAESVVTSSSAPQRQ